MAKKYEIRWCWNGNKRQVESVDYFDTNREWHEFIWSQPHDVIDESDYIAWLDYGDNDDFESDDADLDDGYWAQINVTIPYYVQIEADNAEEAGKKLQELLSDPEFQEESMWFVADVAAGGDTKNLGSIDGVLMHVSHNE